MGAAPSLVKRFPLVRHSILVSACQYHHDTARSHGHLNSRLAYHVRSTSPYRASIRPSSTRCVGGWYVGLSSSGEVIDAG